MTALGQKLPCRPGNATSGLPQITDVNRPARLVRFVPLGDINDEPTIFRSVMRSVGGAADQHRLTIFAWGPKFL
jgi:hypothetical protein